MRQFRWLGSAKSACAVLPVILAGAPVCASADELFDDGKLILTNGVSTVEGTGGGGLATWATISGKGTDRSLGISGHVTLIELPDYGLQSHGLAIGIHDRVELAYARQNFDTRKVGAALGLGRGFTFSQDVFSAKVRLVGDVVYGDPLLPQISIGAEFKRNLDGPVVRAVGARKNEDAELTVSATKLFLAQSLLVNTTFRLTRANQFGLLGYGGDKNGSPEVQFEGSLAYMLSPRLVVGGEYRTKPDNLAIAREGDAHDVFVAYAPTRNVTVTAAYVDLGSIATFDDQRGGFLSLQLAY